MESEYVKLFTFLHVAKHMVNKSHDERWRPNSQCFNTTSKSLDNFLTSATHSGKTFNRMKEATDERENTNAWNNDKCASLI